MRHPFFMAKKILILLSVLIAVLAPLAYSPSAYSREPTLQASNTEPQLQDKKSRVKKKQVGTPVPKPDKSAKKKAKQLPPEKGEKQDCEVTNCNEQQSARRPRMPLGARISDALTRQDREAAADILEHERILLNDEMNLLFLAGRKNAAADNAFTLMERASQNESLYEQAAPILMANARASGVMTTFRTFDSYTGINTEVSTSGHALGRLKLDLSVHREARTNVNRALLADAPDEGGGKIALHQNGDSYVNTLKLRTSQSMNTQTGMSLNHHHQIGSRLQLDALLAFNQPATENAALRIIGRSNHIALESSYRLDNANQWIMRGGHYQYHSIEGQKLGSGDLFTSTLSHQLSGVHPALRTRISGTYSQFKTADQVISGKAASLIPAGESNTAAFFMPQDVSEIAAYISLGDASDNKLPARSLEYRAEIGVFDNPSTGSGWRASAGLAGRILGADRLHMFIRYDQSPNGQGFSSLEAGMAYLLFY